MLLAIIQFSPLLFHKEKNIEKMLHYINKTNADIIVFPELSTSGYFFTSKDEVRNLSENFDSGNIKLFQSLSTQQNKTIVFGFPENYNDNLFNSAAVLMPDASTSRIYRKTHLFYKEKFSFESGDTGFFVINDKERDVKIGTMICYDWRFPEAARALTLQGADIILCPSNLVTDVWQKVMMTRALENKVYLAVANRIGKETRDEEELLFNGDSAVYDFNGTCIAKAGRDTEEVLIVEIYPEKTRDKSINKYNDIIKDRKSDFYKF